MKFIELVQNKCYVRLNEPQEYLLKFKNDGKHNSDYINQRDKTFHINGDFNSSLHPDFREATNEETRWIEECIKQNKFVSRSEIKNPEEYAFY